MFSCQSYIILPIISIILIISIIILVLYKNNSDKISNTDPEPFENEDPIILASQSNIERVFTDNDIINDKINENTILANYEYIMSMYNNYINKLYSKQEIDNLFNTNISEAINDNTQNLIDNNNNTNENIENNIIDLENKLSDLENITNKLKINKIEQNKYSKIKSLNNGQEFCLKQTPKTNFVNPQTGYLTGGYMVNMNDGCLSVGASDYNVYKCNDENKKHLFKMKHIINEQDYELNIDKTVPFDNIDKTKINYPFALIKSVNNNNCLTNKNGNVTVQPCNSFVAQRWIPL